VVIICTSRFNIQQFFVLPSQCLYVFCLDLRTNSYYFPIQHLLAGFYNRDLKLKAQWSLYVLPGLTLINSTFCPQCVNVFFVDLRKKQRLFPYTTTTGCFLQGGFNPLNPSGYYMYHQFNIQQVYILPTQCIYVLCMGIRTNSDYFPIER